MKHAVAVNSIIATRSGATVEASSGSPEGPPFVRFAIHPAEVRECFVGKRYILTVEAE